MTNVTLNLLYHEMKLMREEIHELKSVLIPEEEISEAERIELRATVKEMQSGKEKDWREVAGA